MGSVYSREYPSLPSSIFLVTYPLYLSAPTFQSLPLSPYLTLGSHFRSLQSSIRHSRPRLLPSPPFFLPSILPSPSVSIKLRTIKSQTTYFLLRYRTKCKRLEREAEQGLSAHPQEPLVCDTSYSTSLCVSVLCLVVSQCILTRLNLCVVFL